MMLRYRPNPLLIALLLLGVFGTGFSSPPGLLAQGLPADYARAEAIYNSTDSLPGLVIGVPSPPVWIEGTHTLWYLVTTDGGYRFVRVDADTGEKVAAFDHDRLATSLSGATGEDYTAVTIPHHTRWFQVLGDFDALDFEIDGRAWRCSLSDYRCAQTAGARERDAGSGGDDPVDVLLSPDGRWEALVRDHNVAIRRVGSSDVRALSTEGSEGDGYEIETLSWSPNSRKLAAYRVTPGALPGLVHVIESSPQDQFPPRLHSWEDWPHPGSVLADMRPVLFDIETGDQVVVDRTLFPNARPGPLGQSPQWWEDSRAFTFSYSQRGIGPRGIIEVDAATGAARVLLDEPPDGFVGFGVSYQYDTYNGEEIIWGSERDGWRHLYLYDGHTGEVKNQITQGEWVVKGVDYVDEANRQIWFRAGGTQAGQNPYFSHYFRVGFDGAGLTQFTDANGHHQVTWSPDREFYVDTWSRQDAPPVSMLRRTRDQSVVMELERADISALIAQEWTSPEPFVAKGHDGVTDIWGVIVRPSNFDPSRRYPVIEYIYATQSPQLLKDFQISANFQRGARLSVFRWHRQMMTLAELGFIVVQIEGMGSSGRSKAFQAVRRKNVKGDGYPDRIRWHQAVAEQYSYYDVTRVGLIGFSAGGRAAADGIIFFPEFYDVAVASSGGYDLRLGIMAWERYLGWPVGPLYAENSVLDNAWRLQGKLLISVGETDIATSHTLRFAAALIKANKDFDMAVVPVRGHSAPWRGMFFQRKAWDFFVKHLLGVEPPDRNAVGAGSCESSQCQPQ